MKLTRKTRDYLTRKHGEGHDDATLIRKLGADLVAGRMSPGVFTRLQGGKTVVKSKTETTKPGQNFDPGSKAGKLWGAAARVKNASERFDTKKTTVLSKGGKPLTLGEGTKQLEGPSEYDRALIGSFTKLALRRVGISTQPLTDLDRALLAESAEKHRWVGRGLDGFDYGAYDATVPADQVKALLDDTISGGLYMNPVAFDEAVILYPLLHSEILPFVDTKDVTGRRIIAPTMQNMTVGWGVAPGTPVAPMSTAGLVGAVNTPIFNCSGFIEISNDLLSDSPVSIGETIIALYGEKLKAELDRVIVTGDGVVEPGGISNASGLIAVNSDAGSGGPLTVSDAQALIFALPVQYRRRTEWNSAFIMADASYSRFKAIPVGVGDERRVFGNTYMGTGETQSYGLFEYPCRISSDLPGSKIIFGALKKYRLYRRLGMEFVAERGGRQLQLNNTSLLGVRSRFGGGVVDANAFALMVDAAS